LDLSSTTNTAATKPPNASDAENHAEAHRQSKGAAAPARGAPAETTTSGPTAPTSEEEAKNNLLLAPKFSPTTMRRRSRLLMTTDMMEVHETEGELSSPPLSPSTPPALSNHLGAHEREPALDTRPRPASLSQIPDRSGLTVMCEPWLNSPMSVRKKRSSPLDLKHTVRKASHDSSPKGALDLSPR
jgi:hypothetical protein